MSSIIQSIDEFLRKIKAAQEPKTEKKIPMQVRTSSFMTEIRFCENGEWSPWHEVKTDDKTVPPTPMISVRQDELVNLCDAVIDMSHGLKFYKDSYTWCRVVADVRADVPPAGLESMYGQIATALLRKWGVE